ncbi:MAG: IPTL-CTERM sorting domain-containing protein [Phycisphaerales bacterium]|nr:IPTL-CTERM sorting domain-containing protein [Phycisphaerales bacterium]
MFNVRKVLAAVSLFALAFVQPSSADCPPRCAVGPGAGCPIAVGAGACRYSSFEDTKGGLWCYVCTNVAGGDYEWWYDAAGAKPNKVVGRCVFKGGKNNHGYITDEDDPDQRIIYWHYVIDGNDHKHVVFHLWFKDLNRGFEFELQFNNETGEWDVIDIRPYESLDDPTTPLPIPSVYSVNLGLLATNVPANPSVVDIKWSAPDPEPTPVLTPGDSIYLAGISPSHVVNVDPNFAVTPSPPSGPVGVILTAQSNVPLLSGDYLATIQRPSQPALLYAVRDQGAEAFYMNVLNGAPLDSSWSSRLDLSDMVGYVAASGEMDIPALGIPAVSEFGLGVLALLMVGIGAMLLRKRATPTSA